MNKYQWFVFAIIFFISSLWFSNFFISVDRATELSFTLGTILGGVFSALSIAFGICGCIEIFTEKKR